LGHPVEGGHMSATEAREAVGAAIEAFGDRLSSFFDCVTFPEDDGQLTVLCTRPHAGQLALPKAVSFTIDLAKYRTFDAVRRVTIDRLCELLINGPTPATT
jgi:hypothetical protein